MAIRRIIFTLFLVGASAAHGDLRENLSKANEGCNEIVVQGPIGDSSVLLDGEKCTPWQTNR